MLIPIDLYLESMEIHNQGEAKLTRNILNKFEAAEIAGIIKKVNITPEIPKTELKDQGEVSNANHARTRRKK